MFLINSKSLPKKKSNMYGNQLKKRFKLVFILQNEIGNQMKSDAGELWAFSFVGGG